jgi:4-amino-4-deoxy-L-arabinose transferase-like glycosyltransferase
VNTIRRNELLWLGVLTLVGAGARVFDLGAQSLWLDELFSVFVARRDLYAIVASTAQDTMPPLYYLLLHFALRLGSDETAARAISCLFSIVTIPLFYALARQCFDVRVAILATLALVLNPFHVLFAQEARMYALLVFLTLTSFVFFLRAWCENRTRDWIGFALLQTLAFYTHSLAFLNVLALDVFVLTQRVTLLARWRALGVAHLIVGILFAPWIFVMTQQIARVQSGFWGTPPSPFVLVTTPYLMLFSNTAPVLLVPLGLFATLALLILAMVAARRATSSEALLFAACVAIVPLVTLFAISLARPMFVERTLIVSSFGWYLLVAWAVVNAPPRVLNRALGALGLVVMLVSLVNYFFNPEMQKPPFRDVARALVAQFQIGDAVVHTSDSSALAFMYYAPRLPNEFLAGDPDYVNETTRGRSGRIAGLMPREMNEIIAGRSRVWLVVALDHNEEYQRAQVQKFDARYRRAKMTEVGNIALVLYEVQP